jgi:pectate lyase
MVLLKNNNYYFICLVLIAFSSVSCALIAARQVVQDPPVAFPGAEGYGKYTTGGRGGRVLVVSNLNDSGTGSLRDAVKLKEPRIIVFTVSGTIHLQSELPIQGNVTIAGQTAPGDGICLADYSVNLKGDNAIIRYMRFRMGDKNQNKGMIDGAGSDDAFGANKRQNVVIDHCSMSWSTDEACSFYAGDSTTLQWNIISEPLNYSYHFEKGDKVFENHGFGGIWGGRHASFHHNLFAHCNSRTPRFDGIRNIDSENVDYRNNVIYNWGTNNVYAGEGGNYNIVNNYYKYGPSTSQNRKFRIVNPYKTAAIPFGKFFVSGNYVDGDPEMTRDNPKGVIMNDGTPENKEIAVVKSAFVFEKIKDQSAEKAYQAVLEHAGASLPKRDTLDQRIINDVKNRTGRLIDVQGGYAHGTAYPKTINAWPSLKSEPAPEDADRDGMPDKWEKANGLNPSDASDSVSHTLHKHYTNIEMYINSLVKES